MSEFFDDCSLLSEERMEQFDYHDIDQCDLFQDDNGIAFFGNIMNDENESKIEFTGASPDSNIIQNTGSGSDLGSDSYFQIRQMINEFKITSNLNSQHCTTNAMFDSNSKIDYFDSVNFRPALAGRRKKLKLSKLASNFKSNFYLIFTNKKRFPKSIVRKIHQSIEEPLHLQPFTRDFIRCIDLYFVNFASRSNEIITYLCAHKQQILKKYPELNG